MKPEDKKREDFLKHLEEASKIVNSWPAWKRNILKYSSRATNDIPRQPVLQGEYNMARPNYLLCDKCGEKIPLNYTTVIACGRCMDAAGDSDTENVTGDFCDKCLTQFLYYLLCKSDREDVYKIGRLFKEWIKINK